MKLVPVRGTAFSCHCQNCGESLVAGDTPYKSAFLQRIEKPDVVYADLEGKPFEAYYCAPCARTLVAVMPLTSPVRSDTCPESPNEGTGLETGTPSSDDTSLVLPLDIDSLSRSKIRLPESD